MKWFRRVISSAVIAAGYTVLLGAGLFLVTAKGTGILELPSYYREHSVSPVFVCGGAFPDLDEIIWLGTQPREEFDRICRRVIELYFKRPNYYKINGCPVFMIYEMSNLVRGLGGIDGRFCGCGFAPRTV